jgi:hypothetical protein
MTTHRERMHDVLDRRMSAGPNRERIHKILDGVLDNGPIPDEQLPVDKQGTPLAFGNAPTRLGENMISDFNTLGKRLRGE